MNTNYNVGLKIREGKSFINKKYNIIIHYVLGELYENTNK